MDNTIRIPEGRARVVDRSDVVVVGGGPAGIAAAVSAARNGASVTLLERYPYVGGLAAGGMVLVLDDMTNGLEITVQGICTEMIERMRKLDPPAADPRVIAPAHLNAGVIRDLLAGLLDLGFAHENQPGHHQRLRPRAALGETAGDEQLVDALLFGHEIRR